MTDYTHIVSPHEPTATKPTHPRRSLLTITTVVVLLLGLGMAGYVFWPRTFDVTGTLLVKSDDRIGCYADPGFKDIYAGAQVVVSGKSGETLAIGRLEVDPTFVSAARCNFVFTVEGVPAGEDFYGIEVSHRGRLQYSEADVQRPIHLTLG